MDGKNIRPNHIMLDSYMSNKRRQQILFDLCFTKNFSLALIPCDDVVCCPASPAQINKKIPTKRVGYIHHCAKNNSLTILNTYMISINIIPPIPISVNSLSTFSSHYNNLTNVCHKQNVKSNIIANWG